MPNLKIGFGIPTASLLLFCSLPALADAVLFGSNSNRELISIAIDNAQVTPIGSPSAAIGLAFDWPHGTMYGLAEAPNPSFRALYRIDLSSATRELVSEHEILPHVNGLAFSPDYSRLFTVTQEPRADLYSIDPSTGLDTLIGPTGIDQTGIDVATDSAGRLFIAGLEGGLFIADTASGHATRLFADVADGKGLSAIAFDPSGNLYGITALEDNFVRIDLVSGTSTIIGVLPYPNTDIRGLSFASTVVPSPSSMSTALFGTFFVLVAARAGRVRKTS